MLRCQMKRRGGTIGGSRVSMNADRSRGLKPTAQRGCKFANSGSVRNRYPARAARILPVLVLCFSIGSIRVSHAQSDQRATIEQALTENARITLENVPLRDAVAAITEQTGVEVHMAPDVTALVPGGGSMVIQRVEIANVPLREGLHQVFAPLGMTFRVLSDGVHIEPKDAIRCLGRAPTWPELDVLAELARTEPNGDPAAMDSMRKRVQFRVPVREPWSILEKAMRDAGAGSAEQLLTVACNNLGWSWCLGGDYVVVTPKEQDVLRRLQHPIALRVSGEPLFDAIMAVGDAAGVAIRIEPGALAALAPAVQRSFTLELADQTAERALELIAAYTGLGFLIEPDGVLFFKTGATGGGGTGAAGGSGPASARDPYVGKVVVPLSDGTTMEWLVRFSELPPALRDRRTDDLRRAFKALE